MATVTYIGYAKQSAATAKGLCEYVSQEQKTMQGDGLQLVSGQNCSPQFAVQEFVATRQMHRKKSPVWFYHYVQSFHPDEPVTGEQAHTIAKEFAAQAWPDHEILIATHVDADHIHSHFIVHAVCLESGKMLRQSPNTLKSLRKISDELCRMHGLSVLPPKPRTQSKGMSGREYRSAAKGQSVKFQLMSTIDRCMKYAESREQFISLMKNEGCDVSWTDSRKHITYTTPSGWKCRDDKLHEEKYLKERMEKEFAYRREIAYGGIKAAQYTAPTAAAGTGSSHTGRVDAAAGAAGGSVRPAGGAALQREPSARPLRDTGADAGADPGSTAAETDSGTGWETEREALFSSVCQTAQVASSGMGLAHGSDRSYDVGSVVSAVVGLGRRLEQPLSPGPVNDSTTMHHHTDKKTLRKEKEKKMALGQKEDDHEDEQQTWQQHI